jgi:hypothetical protein
MDVQKTQLVVMQVMESMITAVIAQYALIATLRIMPLVDSVLAMASEMEMTVLTVTLVLIPFQVMQTVMVL